MSFGALTCFAGYLIFHQIKLSQMIIGVYHYEELVETIEMDILFAIFGAQNKKILILQIKKRINMQVGPTYNSAM